MQLKAQKKRADLIHDAVRFVMKAMFGIMMGINVIQGMIVPLTTKLEQSAFLKMAGAIPGVGNTVSSVAGTMLCAGALVKNAIGAVGVIAVLFCCGIPLLRLYLHKFLFQIVNAVACHHTHQRNRYHKHHAADKNSICEQSYRLSHCTDALYNSLVV